MTITIHSRFADPAPTNLAACIHRFGTLALRYSPSTPAYEATWARLTMVEQDIAAARWPSAEVGLTMLRDDAGLFVDRAGEPAHVVIREARELMFGALGFLAEMELAAAGVVRIAVERRARMLVRGGV